MKIHLHASCWNEERMLPFFFRHYDPFVDHYFIHDNQSSDGSLNILNVHPRVTVLPLILEGESLCQAAFEQVNDFWKCSRGAADWVAVCNIDEFFWHIDLPWYLRQCRRKGITYIPSIGYNIVTDEFPNSDENLCLTRRWGARAEHLDKPSFFNPNAITHSGFSMARHGFNPQGKVVYPKKREILLLHFKHLGLEYLVTRHEELGARMRKGDRDMHFGYHYDARITKERHYEYKSQAKIVIPRTQNVFAKWRRRIWDRDAPIPDQTAA